MAADLMNGKRRARSASWRPKQHLHFFVVWLLAFSMGCVEPASSGNEPTDSDEDTKVVDAATDAENGETTSDGSCVPCVDLQCPCPGDSDSEVCAESGKCGGGSRDAANDISDSRAEDTLRDSLEVVDSDHEDGQLGDSDSDVLQPVDTVRDSTRGGGDLGSAEDADTEPPVPPTCPLLDQGLGLFPVSDPCDYPILTPEQEQSLFLSPVECGPVELVPLLVDWDLSLWEQLKAPIPVFNDYGEVIDIEYHLGSNRTRGVLEGSDGEVIVVANLSESQSTHYSPSDGVVYRLQDGLIVDSLTFGAPETKDYVEMRLGGSGQFSATRRESGEDGFKYFVHTFDLELEELSVTAWEKPDLLHEHGLVTWLSDEGASVVAGPIEDFDAVSECSDVGVTLMNSAAEVVWTTSFSIEELGTEGSVNLNKAKSIQVHGSENCDIFVTFLTNAELTEAWKGDGIFDDLTYGMSSTVRLQKNGTVVSRVAHILGTSVASVGDSWVFGDEVLIARGTTGGFGIPGSPGFKTLLLRYDSDGSVKWFVQIGSPTGSAALSHGDLLEYDDDLLLFTAADDFDGLVYVLGPDGCPIAAYSLQAGTDRRVEQLGSRIQLTRLDDGSFVAIGNVRVGAGPHVLGPSLPGYGRLRTTDCDRGSKLRRRREHLRYSTIHRVRARPISTGCRRRQWEPMPRRVRKEDYVGATGNSRIPGLRGGTRPGWSRSQQPTMSNPRSPGPPER